MKIHPVNRYNWTLWYFSFAVLVGVGLWVFGSLEPWNTSF